MPNSQPLEIRDDAGNPIQSIFSVTEEDGEWSVVLESRGGPKGSPNERNGQYAEGLELLLARLGTFKCELRDAVVDSRTTQRLGLSRDDRRLDGINYPVALQATDVVRLRLDLCKAQRIVGRAPGVKAGNNTKRIRLYVHGLSGTVDQAAEILAAYRASTATDDSEPPVLRKDRIRSLGSHSTNRAWLEMSRDAAHGGPGWEFGNCLLCPTERRGGGPWGY